MRNFFESMSLSGAIVLLLFLLTVIGLGMDIAGVPSGEKVWNNFGSGFLAFVSGRALGARKRVISGDDQPPKP